MRAPGRVGDLEIDQDLSYERAEWIAQRVSWVVMLLIIIAALAGVFGRGWLSAATAGAAGAVGDSLQLRYDRFPRLVASTELHVTVIPADGAGGRTRVWLSRGYLDGFRVQHTTPPPERVDVGVDRLIYTFPIASHGEPAELVFNLETTKMGRREGQVGLMGGPALTIHQFVYP